MSLKAEFRIKLDEALGEQRDKIDKELEKQLANHVVRIKQFALSGLDFEGKGLGGYRSRWKKVREAGGRQTAFVDLHFSGNMMKAMFSEISRAGTKTTGEISFRDTTSAYSGRQLSSNKSASNRRLPKGRTVRDRKKAEGLQNRFKFFGISKKQIAEILNKLQQSIRIK